MGRVQGSFGIPIDVGIAMMRMMKLVRIGVGMMVAWLWVAGEAPAGGRVVTNLDDDWRFALGDHRAAKGAGFDDSDWRWIDVPHDWAFEADFDPE